MSSQPSGPGSASPSGAEDATAVATGPRALKAKLAWELKAQFDRRRQQRARDGEVAGFPSAPAQATAPFDTFSDAFDAFETELKTAPHALLARVLFAQFERSTHLPNVTPAEFCHVDRSDGLPLERAYPSGHQQALRLPRSSEAAARQGQLLAGIATWRQVQGAAPIYVCGLE